jgi:predicted peptidase
MPLRVAIECEWSDDAFMNPLAFASGLPLVALALAMTVPASGAADEGRFVYRTVRVDHGSHRYAVWLPPGHAAQPKTKWPAIVFLHGSGECGSDGEKQTHIGFGPALAAHRERWPFVVVFPQKPLEDEEWEEREALVFAELADAGKAFGIDPARVALAGMSQGGHGTWFLGARHPDRWVCLVPICGYGRARSIQHRAMHLPVWAFHGLRDDVVDPNDTRKIVAGLREARTAAGLDPEAVHMTLFPDANHNSWDPAFAHDSLNVWMREQLGVK